MEKVVLLFSTQQRINTSISVETDVCPIYLLNGLKAMVIKLYPFVHVTWCFKDYYVFETFKRVL